MRSNVIPWPGSPAVLAELARLHAVEAAALALVAKVDEHERCGYGRIRCGVARDLRDALTRPATPTEGI